MGQITKDTIAMIRKCVEQGSPPPLTAWEYEQLCRFAEAAIAAPTSSAEHSGHDPAGPRDDRFVCDLCDEDGVIVYKRSEFTKNWTTFNVRKECANLAEERLKSPSRAELRAKVEALREVNFVGYNTPMLVKSDVLALLGDKQ